MTTCAASSLCVDYDRRTEAPALAEDGPLCEGDLLAGERAVTALVFDYVALEQLLPPALGVWGDGQPSAEGELQVPMRLEIEAAQAEIHWVLTTWEQVVRERDKLSDSVTRGVRAGWAVDAAAKILRPRIRLLAAIDPVEVADYPNLDEAEALRFGVVEHAWLPGWRGVLDFDRLRHRAKLQLGLLSAKPERCEGIPCRNRDCEFRALYREQGSDDVLCGHCKERYSPQQYLDWVRLVHGHVRCPTCDEKIKAVGPPDEDGNAVVKPCEHLIIVERFMQKAA